MTEHPVTLAVSDDVYNRARRIAEATAQSVEEVLARQLEEAFIASLAVYHDPTREELIEELNKLRASGTYDHVESLYGKYANPDVPEMSETEFHASLHQSIDN